MMFTCHRSLFGVGLIALLATEMAAQEPTRITGEVTGEEGNPLPAATVAISGLGVGALTATDGRYVLTVPADRAQGQMVTVLARAIGYKPDSVQLTLTPGALSQSFALESNPLRLGEVVVTGAGTVSEVQKLANVRNNVDSSLIQRSHEPNVVTALAAKAPNVEIVSTAGDPGASTSIRIRGGNTLGGTSDPLFVVDGTPIDNSTFTTGNLDPLSFGGQGGTVAPNRAADINPADIESVEILKGAAAGAIYGARAGQGVVLITTKRGRPGATRYSLRSSFSINDVRRFPPLQRRFGQGDGGAPDPCATSLSLDCDATTYSYGPAIPEGTPTFDHGEEMFRTGHTTDNTLTISGGSDRTTFLVSGAYMNQRGTFIGPNNDYRRISVRLKGTHQVFDDLSIGGNVAYASSDGDFVQKGSNFSALTLGAWRTPPDFDNREYLSPTSGMHRSYRFPNPSDTSAAITRGYDNPFFSAIEAVSKASADRVFGNLSADYAPLPWLRLNYTLGVDYTGDERLQGQPQTTSNTPDPLGQVIRLSLTNLLVDHNLVGTASYTVNPNFAGSVSLGQNLNSRNVRQLGLVGNRLLAPRPFTLSNTSSQNPPTDVQTRVRLEGYFGQATFDLYEQLFLKAGLRYDGSSTFGATNQRNWFPSAQAAWQFTNVVGDLGGILSFGKLRLAYGEVGTEPLPYLKSFVFLGGGSFLDDFGLGVTASQGGFGGLYSDSSRAATELKPERTKELEMGFDLGLFEDKADLSFTYFRRKSTDVILRVPVAASSGFRFEAKNGGEIENTGTEFSLNIRPITRPNFGWEVGLQFGTLDNEVLSLEGAEFVEYGGLGGFGISVAQVGEAIGAFRDYDFVRCGRGLVLDDGTPEGFDVDAACGEEGVRNGALYIDDGTFSANGPGYPIPDFDNLRVIGDPNPDWTASVRNLLRFGKLTVSGLLDIREGGLVYNGTRGALITLGTHKETERRGEMVVFGDSYLRGPTAGPGQGLSVPLTEGWFRGDGGAFAGPGAPFYEDGSFVKLREISIGYTLSDDAITRALRLGSIDLQLAGRNLAVWTDYTGADPETNLAGAETGARGVDWFNNPQTRSFVFTVVLNR